MSTHRMTTPIFSAEYWALKNPVLLKGERGLAEFYDEDGHVTRIREKVGDGVMGEDRVITGTHWNDLPWIMTGEKGDKGDVGPRPEHNWKGTSLRFQNADSTWGEYVDLKGEPGNRVNAEPATSTTLGGVKPATGLRVDIEGYEYVALGWSEHACYPDPIIVSYDNSAWLWLQKSGVGTAAGVRTPGAEESGQYWKRIANVEDIPGPGMGLEYDKENNTYNVKYGNIPGTALEGDGTALASKKLETPRTFTVNVGSNQGVSFDGTKDVSPGVTGILPVANGGTGTNSLSTLANQLTNTGILGGTPRLVYTGSPGTQGSNIVITGLTPGRLLLWMVIANQNDLYRKVSTVYISAPHYSVDSGLLVGMGLKQKTTIFGMGTSFPLSAIGYRDKGSTSSGGNQNMDMAIITGTTVRLFMSADGDDYPEVRFYML
ncbi:MAG TPA: hypothetical protein H9768_11595 [Candidatus Mailhella merdavium]|nr:hypothetical protein [Candidatus Mailhella merdavium]